MAERRDRVVVIGAGLGGLAAALRLAHAGVGVTVLERAAGPGGKMRTTASIAGPVDSGPTVLTLRPVFEALFADAGERLADHVTLIPEPVLARHWWADGSVLDLHADTEASAEAIRAFAGARAETEFRRFTADAKRLFRAFDTPMMQAARPRRTALMATVLRNPRLIAAMAPHLTLAGSLARRFSDPRLRQLFGRYATYVGGSPYASPALLGLIWHSEAQGVWRVEGGMHRLAQAIAALCTRKGVVFRYGSDVARIEMQWSSVKAVILEDGRRIAADRVIFNGDPAALHRGLLGQAVRQAVTGAGVAPRSLSAWVWSFAATASGPDLIHHNVFFGRDPAAEFGDLAQGLMPADPTLYICAQDRGAAPRAGGPERFEIIMNGAPLRSRQASAAAEDIARCRTQVFQTLQDRGLTFGPAPEAAALTTPAGFAALYPGSDGSLFGRSPHGLTASLQRPGARTPIPGLYLAGGGAHPGAGMPMATLSGRHAAEAILKDLALTSPSRRTVTPGGTLTGSATTGPDRSASSAS